MLNVLHVAPFRHNCICSPIYVVVAGLYFIHMVVALLYYAHHTTLLLHTLHLAGTTTRARLRTLVVTSTLWC
jgi:hypothetical protein